MRRALLLAGWILAGSLLLSSNALAQAADTVATQELIQKLLSRIDTLEKRISELEKQAPAPPIAQAPKPVRAPEAEHVHDAQPQPEAAAQVTYPSLKISGFSDFNFAARSEEHTSELQSPQN